MSRRRFKWETHLSARSDNQNAQKATDTATDAAEPSSALVPFHAEVVNLSEDFLVSVLATRPRFLGAMLKMGAVQGLEVCVKAPARSLLWFGARFDAPHHFLKRLVCAAACGRPGTETVPPKRF